VVETQSGDQDQVNLVEFHRWATCSGFPYAVSAGFEVGVQIVYLGWVHGCIIPVDPGDADPFVVCERGSNERIKRQLGREGGVREDGGRGSIGGGVVNSIGNLLGFGGAVGRGNRGEGGLEGGPKFRFSWEYGHAG